MNKYRLLGSAVLLYAFVTSGALLSLISGWPGAVNGVLWLVYVLGGFGLIREKGWGRAPTADFAACFRAPQAAAFGEKDDIDPPA